MIFFSKATLAKATLAETLRVNSFRKGLLGGSRVWLLVFVVRAVLRGLRKVSKRTEMPVRFSEKLAVGEVLVIRHLDQDTQD